MPSRADSKRYGAATRTFCNCVSITESSSPAVFSYKDKDLIAVANKDGKLYLLDSAALGGTDHKTPLAYISYATSGPDAGALATWEDASGARWILVGAPTAIKSFKVVDQNGKVMEVPLTIWAHIDSFDSASECQKAD